MTRKIRWRSGTYTLVIIRWLVSESLYTDSDCYPLHLKHQENCFCPYSCVNSKGHSINTAAYRKSNCLSSPQAGNWKAIHFAAEFYTKETLACELWQCWYPRMHFKNYQFSGRLIMKKWKPGNDMILNYKNISSNSKYKSTF